MSFTEQLLQHPFSCICSGPSKAGKTVFATKFLKHVESLIDKPPLEITWFFSEYQPNYRELVNIPNVTLKQGLPDLENVERNASKPRLWVLDDLMSDLKDSALIKLFTKGVHHWGISCVFIVQNIFFGGLRTARVNAHYLVLFKNPSDQLQVSTLAKQLYPRKSSFFIEAYQDATIQPHTYLFIDLSQSCPSELRLRTNIFPGEVTIVYSP